MANNFFSNYDPLYTNGILYAPVNDLIFSDAPIVFPRKSPYPQTSPITAEKVDKFVSTAKNPNPTPTWKKVLAFGVLAALTVLGLRKFKMNPFKKIKNAVKPKNIWENIKNGFSSAGKYVADKYRAVKGYILSKFHKS